MQQASSFPSSGAAALPPSQSSRASRPNPRLPLQHFPSDNTAASAGASAGARVVMDSSTGGMALLSSSTRNAVVRLPFPLPLLLTLTPCYSPSLCFSPSRAPQTTRTLAPNAFTPSLSSDLAAKEHAHVAAACPRTHFPAAWPPPLAPSLSAASAVRAPPTPSPPAAVSVFRGRSALVLRMRADSHSSCRWSWRRCLLLQRATLARGRRFAAAAAPRARLTHALAAAASAEQTPGGRGE
jgi:hypothetical protein